MRRASIIFIFILPVVIIAGIYFWYISKNNSSQKPTALLPTPTIGVQDTAPDVPASDKVMLLIQNTDSSRVTVLVPKNQVSNYVSHLPQGMMVITPTP